MRRKQLKPPQCSCPGEENEPDWEAVGWAVPGSEGVRGRGIPSSTVCEPDAVKDSERLRPLGLAPVAAASAACSPELCLPPKPRPCGMGAKCIQLASHR